MRHGCLCIPAGGLALARIAGAREFEAQVIGSTPAMTEGEMGPSGFLHGKPGNPTAMASCFQGILSRDAAITGTRAVKISVDLEATRN